MIDYEVRTLPAAYAKTAVSSDGTNFEGHAAVTGQEVAIGDPRTWGFFEENVPGLFKRTIAEGDIAFLLEHDPRWVISRTKAGTLALDEDDIGMAVNSPIDPDLSYGKDLSTNLRNGNIYGMSYAFRPVTGGESWTTVNRTDENGSYVADKRLLTEVSVRDVSAVTFPAYTSTDASLRSVALVIAGTGNPDLIQRKLASDERLRAHMAEIDDEILRRPITSRSEYRRRAAYLRAKANMATDHKL